MRLALVLLCAGAVAGLGAAPANAGRGDVLVAFAPSAGAEERAVARERSDVTREERLPGVPGLEVADPAPGQTQAEAIAALEAQPGVRFAEPDAVRRLASLRPDDPLFPSQWGLESTGQEVGGAASAPDADVDAPEAWAVGTGSSAVKVAVVDSGVATAHPDLAPNLLAGRSFVGPLAQGSADVEDRHGHGTHVAGIVGARGGDATGVAGVAWRVGLLPVRVADGDGVGTVSDAIQGYAFAAAQGARVANLSFGGATRSEAERLALAAAPDVLFVASAGNSAADVDASPVYPCAFDLPNVLCVTATDQADGLPAFASTGATTVDLAAPGVSVLSTDLATVPGGVSLRSGSSMAAPFVTGAAALLLAQDPTRGVPQLRSALLGAVDRRSALVGRTVTAGRLNVARALGLDPPPPPPPAPSTAPTAGPPAAAAAPVAASSSPVPRDARPPALRLAIAGRARLAALRARGLRVTVGCDEACDGRLAIAVDAATRRRTRLPSATVAATAVAASAGRARTVVLRPSRTTARLVRRVRRLAVTLELHVADAAGNRSSRRLRTVLR